MSKHPFHIVSPSPSPIETALSAFFIVCGLVSSWSLLGDCLLILGLCLLFLSLYRWWSNVILESAFLGLHTTRVRSGLRLGMCLFIISEIFFFLAFFWAYLHSALSPNVEIGSCWPPTGLHSLYAFSLPLLNTVLLLSSGATVTWSHHSLCTSQVIDSLHSLLITIILGVSFTLLQGAEYYLCSFSIADSSYGSCFFLATGFHGVHVLIGTLFLTISLFRLRSFHYTSTRHLGFLFAC